jgi:Sec-independent protein translocase protein TatA
VEIFGIGPLELLLVLLLALLIFGPKDIEKAGRTLGRSLYKLVNSETWRSITQASRKLKTLPNDLMRAARLEDDKLDAQKAAGELPSTAWKEDPHIQPPQKPPAAAGDAPRPDQPPDE